tara:strand:+ start:280 stop:888 length:609 start_codon:yes stop_codon:yes gene_type:complete
MTTYTFPAIAPVTNTFELITNTRTFKSPLTNAIQTVGRKGSLWKISMQFNNLTGSDRATMQAFLAKLNGQQHRFHVQDHSYTRRGTAPNPADTLLVNAAGQTGATLNADGATLSRTNYLRAGDYVSFNNELHMVTDDCSSSGTGTIAIPVAPPIRKPTDDNDLIDYLVPVLGVFMLTSSASWDTSPGIVSSFTVEAVEDVLA